MALETYKIVNKLTPVCLHDLVNVKNSKYAFRYSNILDVLKSTQIKDILKHAEAISNKHKITK
jgi:isochorismate hydrolase